MDEKKRRFRALLVSVAFMFSCDGLLRLDESRLCKF